MTDTKNEILHQAWLKAACELFRQNFFDFPEVVATYGFPAPNSGDGFRGACHFPVDKDKTRRPVITIHPAEWIDPMGVLTVLLHECVHARLDKLEGHSPIFQKVASDVGLRLSATGTWDDRTEALTAKLQEALKLLPEMPQDPLGRGGVKRQKGRMKLFMCTCKFKIRCGKDSLLAECKRCNTNFVIQPEE